MNQVKTSNQTSSDNQVVLAFSGGLDTSFCVPYLVDKGFDVTTIFVDSGGVSPAQKESIKQRALSLGAVAHHEVAIGGPLWDRVITPLLQSGQWYQNQYPLLCSDRYLIVEACLQLCDNLGTRNFAHGCTGMGNDQVRFDLSVHCLGDYNIIAPIREIQSQHSQVREFEKQFLLDRGFSVDDKVSHYSINENLLGATISGSEIDLWQKPNEASYVMTTPPGKTAVNTTQIKLTFHKGVLSAFNGDPINDQLTGEQIMQQLNQLGGNYALGRGVYTGDTTIGLKGRIVFEAPALHLLNVAHTALEQAVLSKAQNRFKTLIGQKWSELVYEGFFYEPLKNDLEAFLRSSQQNVTGTVLLELIPGQAHAVALESAYILKDSGSVYAQSASWTINEAEGFIKLYGKSSTLSAKQHLSASSNNK
jgi:argininosuccinate synthase